MDKKVRVRFAPSPTGGLHLGGVRTALFNYLFAKQAGGDFILRVEDTDQTRFVPGAEEYIVDCLKWCGLVPDESPQSGGPYAPYRQSERKDLYRQYAEQLVRQGHAYYAFDTPEELNSRRQEIPNFQYGHEHRASLRNSLALRQEEVEQLLADHTPHVIRIKMPTDEIIRFDDLIRGDVTFETSQVDDKVLLKADGMPTYHLAVVVDDYLMKISHAFRGEEWLPSAPVHLLLWKYLGWEPDMPRWAHLPLILKPDGNGKLSKRDGDRLGFPVYAMNWTDPKSGDQTRGFREMGFLPEAFVNMLAMLGWNDGSGQELFTLEELIGKFSVERINKSGAKFDFEKAKWFNAEWIKLMVPEKLREALEPLVAAELGAPVDSSYLERVLALVKDRLVLLTDFWKQASFFYKAPDTYDLAAVKAKWNAEKAAFFEGLIGEYESLDTFEPAASEEVFKKLAEKQQLKTGELMLPFRIMLVGGKFGPQVFEIASMIGKGETISRIRKALAAFEENK